jgi:zinc protease
MMKNVLIAILVTGQLLMANVIETLDVDGVKVPLIFEAQSRLPMVSMQLVFTDGGAITDGAEPGLARLSAKMMNEGTLSDGSVGFAKQLDARAIQMSAHAGNETFVFELGALKEEFPTAVTMLAKLLKEPNLTEESLQRVKAVTQGALKRKENDYDYVANQALKSMLFADTPLAQPAMGTEASVAAISLDAVKGFLKSRLVRSRAIVVIGGDISLDAAKTLIEPILKALPEGEAGELGYYSVQGKPAEEILERETEQAYIYFGSPYDMRVDDEDAHMARVATYILGTGGFGSRLMEEIRVKRGLAYSAYARVNISKSHSYFMGYLQTKNDSLEEARDTVREVIMEFVRKGVSDAELEQAKKFLLGSEPLRVETLAQRLSRTFMEYYKGHEPGYSKRELEKIRELTLEDLNAFIARHDEILQLSFAIVTDNEAEEVKE